MSHFLAVQYTQPTLRFVFALVTRTGFPTVGDLTKWEGLGKPRIIAELLKQRRDSDAAGGAQVESVVLPGIVMEGDVLQVGGASVVLWMAVSRIAHGV